MSDPRPLPGWPAGVPLLGTYRGRGIPAWLDVPDRGGRFTFVGIAREDQDGAVPLDQLGRDEVVICPGLIYRLDQPAPCGSSPRDGE